MTGKTHRSSPGARDAGRLQDLLRADAAAVIDDDLDDETLGEDANLGSGHEHDSASAAQRPRSQVYSIRVPVERLEQVRRLAKERDMAPTVMLREWVLTQLDAETGVGAGVSKHASPEQRMPRETATAAFVGIAAQLAKALEILTQLVAAQNARPVLSPHHAMPLHPTLLHAGSLQAIAGLSVPAWSSTAWSGLSLPADAATQLTIRHVFRGVAELRATVESVSDSHGISNDDLDTLYKAADEELSNS
jgi:hypothetical protein